MLTRLLDLDLLVAIYISLANRSRYIMLLLFNCLCVNLLSMQPFDFLDQRHSPSFIRKHNESPRSGTGITSVTRERTTHQKS